MNKWIQVVCLLLLQQLTYGQTNVSSQNWHWKDFNTDTIHGISLQKAYSFLSKKNKVPSTIIVAVMDGGVDTNQMVLKSRLWTNTKEIPGNGIDDDHNGYIDDIHGWNFLGGKDGQNIDKAADEKSRIYHKYKNLFEAGVDENQLSNTQKKQYELWKKAASEIEFSEQDQANLEYIKMATNAVKKLGNMIVKEIIDTNFTIQKLEPFQPLGRSTLEAKMAYLRTIQILGVDKEIGFSDIITDLNEYIEGKEKAAKAKITPPAPIRANIIKDNYENFADKYYGNNDITGPNSKHGTHVAGLVASIPDSSWQMNKFYPDIKIMSVRVVPDGDEYDKDIALGIKYAVDNGAKIINMSFGKSFSPEQIWVDNAIRYAASKDVLIVHSAGNEFYNLNEKQVYPNPYSSELKDTANNVITIAASSDFFINGTLLTDFSNFGNKIVDLLSPGNKIYSTFPGANNYGYLQGTSMAAPIVSHIAAMIRSYYPNLTAVEVKKILMQSAWKPTEIVRFAIPQKEESKTLDEIAAAGGIANAANAIELASIFTKTRLKKSNTQSTIK